MAEMVRKDRLETDLSYMVIPPLAFPVIFFIEIDGSSKHPSLVASWQLFVNLTFFNQSTYKALYEMCI